MRASRATRTRRHRVTIRNARRRFGQALWMRRSTLGSASMRAPAPQRRPRPCSHRRIRRSPSARARACRNSWEPCFTGRFVISECRISFVGWRVRSRPSGHTSAMRRPVGDHHSTHSPCDETVESDLQARRWRPAEQGLETRQVSLRRWQVEWVGRHLEGRRREPQTCLERCPNACPDVDRFRRSSSRRLA